MVVFYGELSNEAKIDRNKKCTMNMNKLSIGIISVCFICICLAGALNFFRQILIEAVICLMVYISIVISLNVKNPYMYNRIIRVGNAPHITVDDESITKHLWIGGNYYPTKKSLSKVKKVLDCGDWYYIIFKFGDITNSWTCQKDLIVEGTIEEFEKLFEDKIVRKYKKE